MRVCLWSPCLHVPPALPPIAPVPFVHLAHTHVEPVAKKCVVTTPSPTSTPVATPMTVKIVTPKYSSGGFSRSLRLGDDALSPAVIAPTVCSKQPRVPVKRKLSYAHATDVDVEQLVVAPSKITPDPLFKKKPLGLGLFMPPDIGGYTTDLYFTGKGVRSMPSSLLSDETCRWMQVSFFCLTL